MHEPNISLEDFLNSAGTELKTSDWLLIDQQRIDKFADASSDHQFIHVDPEKAAATPFGGTIAHGFLTLSLISHLVAQNMLIPEGITMGINYGSDKVRFIQPVKVNSRVRALTVIEQVKKRRAGQYQIKLGVTIEIENESRPALKAEILSLYFIDEPS